MTQRSKFALEPGRGRNTLFFDIEPHYLVMVGLELTV